MHGASEVAFYAKVAPAMPAGLVPRCFGSDWQDETRQWHLLLEDLTDTHEIATQWPLPPDEATCRRMVQTLARFHAAWWDDPRLGVSIGTRVDAETARQMMQRHAAAFERFADHLGDRLSRERRQLYERFFAAAPGLQARVLTYRNVSLVHGDAHVWNCFVPKDGSDDLRYFDWDTWRIGLASSDLAYMMATHWYPERRRRFERPLLDHYHAALLGHGVQGYDRAASGRGLSPLGADAAPDADAADDGRHPALGVVEPSRAHHGSHRRSRLPRLARLSVLAGRSIGRQRRARRRLLRHTP